MINNHYVSSYLNNKYISYFCVLQNVEFPDSMSVEMKGLLEGLLKRDVDERLGCRGQG